MLAFRVEPSKHTREGLERAHEVAAMFTKAELRLAGGTTWQAKRTRTPGRLYLQNAEARLLWDDDAAGSRARDAGPGPDGEPRDREPGWTLEITLRAIYLATHRLEEAIAYAEQAAAEFGKVYQSRVRRFDLAADFADFPILRSDADTYVRRGRSVIRDFIPGGALAFPDGAEERLEGVAWYDRRFKLTGHTIGQGGPLSCRIYDKIAELNREGNEAKRVVETDHWRALGWQGEPVTRVEFQIRGEALRELGGYFDDKQVFVSPLRDPSNLLTRIDSVWRYCVGSSDAHGWLRMVEPESATRRKRAAIDPRWQAVRSVVFYHRQAERASRVRYRTGATLPMAFGSVLSLLASYDKIERLEGPWHPTEGFQLEPLELASLPADERKAWLLAQVDRVAGAFREVLAAGLLADPNGADRMLALVNANVARFSNRKVPE